MRGIILVALLALVGCQTAQQKADDLTRIDPLTGQSKLSTLVQATVPILLDPTLSDIDKATAIAGLVDPAIEAGGAIERLTPIIADRSLTVEQKAASVVLEAAELVDTSDWTDHAKTAWEILKYLALIYAASHGVALPLAKRMKDSRPGQFLAPKETVA